MFFDLLPDSGYVCAHRGARSLAPENTMLAYQLAVREGADFLELDVHKVADGSLVIFHDETLTRTTDAAMHTAYTKNGEPALHDFSLEELHRLDAGSWFLTADPYGTIAAGGVPADVLQKIPGQRIPTLREVMEFAKRVNLPVNVEIKDQLRAPDDLSIVSDVLAVLDRTQTRDRVLISSFNHGYLRDMHRQAPDIPTAALTEERHPGDTPEELLAYLADLGCTGYHPDAAITPLELVRALAQKDIRVTPYTVNDMNRALELLDTGCFGITTDFPQVLRGLVDERR